MTSFFFSYFFLNLSMATSFEEALSTVTLKSFNPPQSLKQLTNSTAIVSPLWLGT
ncbi:hypothetical protein CsatA_007818 [Cannabis sativa]